MIETVRHGLKPKATQIYHQGLIKILVEYQVRSQGIVWREFMTRNQFNEWVNEVQNKVEQENRGLMSSPLYPMTRAKQQNSIAMQENEVSIMFFPRRFMNKSPIDTEKEVDTYSTRKQVEDDIAQEVFERDSSYDDATAASLIKTTQDFEKEINLGRIKELTDQLEISKIMEKQLKEENKASKQDNTRLVKANERLNEEIGRSKWKNPINPAW